MASQARPLVSRSACAPGTQSPSSTWLLRAPCLCDLLHPIAYDGALPRALGRGWALGAAVEEGGPTTPTPPGAPVPHPCLSGAPAWSDPALAVCRLCVGCLESGPSVYSPRGQLLRQGGAGDRGGPFPSGPTWGQVGGSSELPRGRPAGERGG